jgi:hypothetical protein
MKRAALLLIVTLGILAFQIISNCSQPLESSDLNPSPGPGSPGRVDTLFVFDTIVIVHNGRVDTLIVIDTIIQVDTTVVTDTIIIPDTTIIDTIFDTITIPDSTVFDTVIIVEPGDGPILCDKLSSSQQEIVWLFRNAEGPFHLEFAALPESEHPNHTLTVSIGDQSHPWDLSESLELILDTTLPSNTTIIITTSKPPSFGHAIDVCVTVTKM